MNAIKIDRMKLIGIVQENLRKHVDDWREAIEGFEVAAEKTLAENATIARKNLAMFKQDPKMDLTRIMRPKSFPTIPVSYEKEYKRALRMLELSVEDTIEVEEDVFNQLVLDEWSWKTNFIATASLYNNKFGG